MNLLRTSRLILFGLLLSLAPASSFAGVLISVGIAPPVLPVYVQPACPQPGWMWTPGYWAYGPDGYYWVPGAWVPAPYAGALWTPPYWGFSGGAYVFHPGYWGTHVGFYGGVNYGFGYMGVGFVGGMWHGHDFAYNTAVVHVNNVYIHNTYVDRTIVEHNTIVNEHRVAYSGGPGGIRHEPMPQERVAMNEHHMAETPAQMQHMEAARNDRSFYAKNNGGRPQNVAVSHPMGYTEHGPQGNMRQEQQHPVNNNRGGYNNASRPEYQNHPQPTHQTEVQQPHGFTQPPHQTQAPQPTHRTEVQQPHGLEQQPHLNAPQPHGNPQQRNESHPAPQQHSGGGHAEHEHR